MYASNLQHLVGKRMKNFLSTQSSSFSASCAGSTISLSARTGCSKITADHKEVANQDGPLANGLVSPSEEPFLDLLPLNLAKTVLPPEINPNNFKDKLLNNKNITDVSKIVQERPQDKNPTILIIGGWSDYISSYEIHDCQWLLVQYISRILAPVSDECMRSTCIT